MRRIRELSKQLWFKWRRKDEDALSLVGLAIKLRLSLSSELNSKLDNLEQLSPYERKRRIYRLRFLLSRLIYLADPTKYREIETRIASVPELIVFRAIFGALATGEITDLLDYGTAPAHAVAQAISTTGFELSCRRINWEATATTQAWSVFAAYGIKINGSPPPRFDIVQICDWDERSIELLHSTDAYVQEIACLHGAYPDRRHDELLQSAFDTDDNVAYDLVDLVGGSY